MDFHARFFELDQIFGVTLLPLPGHVGRRRLDGVLENRLDFLGKGVVLILVEDDLEALHVLMEALDHVDLRDVLKPERRIRRRIVEFCGVEHAAVHRRHDIGAAHDRHCRAQLVHQVGGEADRAVLELLELRDVGDRLLEPAQRLRGHRPSQPADDVHLQDVVQELVVELLPFAVVEPAEKVVGDPAERGRRAEQRERLVLAVPVGAYAVSAVEHPGADRVLHAEGADHRAGWKNVELESIAGHLVHTPRVVLGVFVEDVLGGPGALEPPCNLGLRGRDRRKTKSCSGGGARRSLQELAPRVGSRGNGLG